MMTFLNNKLLLIMKLLQSFGFYVVLMFAVKFQMKFRYLEMKWNRLWSASLGLHLVMLTCYCKYIALLTGFTLHCPLKDQFVL